MPQDYIPLHRNNYRTWLNNLGYRAPLDGAEAGAPPADAPDIMARTAAQLALMTATDQAKTALRGARAAERAGRVETNQFLRKKMGQWKRMDGFTAVHAISLRVKSKAKVFDPVNYKPTFKVRVIPGGIRLDWKKRGADGVVIYCRLAGTTVWIKIGVDTMSPYLDARPLATPGVPEVREYRLLGMVNDVEIGQSSNIVSVGWSGQ